MDTFIFFPKDTPFYEFSFRTYILASISKRVEKELRKINLYYWKTASEKLDSFFTESRTRTWY